MDVSIAASLGQVDPQQWDRLNTTDYPFLKHSFLYALESTQCVGERTGWTPYHVIVRDRGQLVAGAPTYIKNHSYGEFVFDFSWAAAFQRAGMAYYPKLVTAIPFTPATGPRFLTAAGYDRAELVALMAATLREHCDRLDASGWHCLFANDEEISLLERQSMLRRISYQFHWHNGDHRDFDAFLASLTSKKRKNIRQERRRVSDAGITVRPVAGGDVTDHQWNDFFEMYRANSLRKGGTPYLRREFFPLIGRQLGNQVQLFIAECGGAMAAAALCLRDRTTLYGRHWGTARDMDGLHFETCYYAPINYAISHRLERFEAGAQGDHKLSRGLLPCPTYSAHWIEEPAWRPAIQRFLAEESAVMDGEMDLLQQHGPFRQSEGDNAA